MICMEKGVSQDVLAYFGLNIFEMLYSCCTPVVLYVVNYNCIILYKIYAVD